MRGRLFVTTMSTRTTRLQLLAQAAAVCVLGGAAGVATNRWSAHPVSLAQPIYAAASTGAGVCSAESAQPAEHTTVPRMSLAEARSACLSCTAAFVDARAASAFAEGHVPGAVHLPPAEHPDMSAVMDKLRAHHTVIVYDDDVGCQLAEGAARRLRAEGLPDVRVLDGNWTQWEASGAPAESGSCELCPPPSVASESRP